MAWLALIPLLIVTYLSGAWRLQYLKKPSFVAILVPQGWQYTTLFSPILIALLLTRVSDILVP
jgi:hypothetical protein